MVLNDPPLPAGHSMGGPCYRCIFPKPPSADSVTSCEEGGIIGAVVGVLGVYQALEAIKLMLSQTKGSLPRTDNHAVGPGLRYNTPTMMLFSAFGTPPFRSVRLRGRRKQCAICSEQAIINTESLITGSLDYLEFCNVNRPIKILRSEERVSVTDYQKIRQAGTKHILIDVRESAMFDIWSLQGSINLPLSEIQSENVNLAAKLDTTPVTENSVSKLASKGLTSLPIYVLCRIGNDSQIAVQSMKTAGLHRNGERQILDIEGGLKAWKNKVDGGLPFY